MPDIIKITKQKISHHQNHRCWLPRWCSCNIRPSEECSNIISQNRIWCKWMAFTSMPKNKNFSVITNTNLKLSNHPTMVESNLLKTLPASAATYHLQNKMLKFVFQTWRALNKLASYGNRLCQMNWRETSFFSCGNCVWSYYLDINRCFGKSYWWSIYPNVPNYS